MSSILKSFHLQDEKDIAWEIHSLSVVDHHLPLITVNNGYMKLFLTLPVGNRKKLYSFM